ncbi:mannose-1-phosphate guanylyltransferase/mannose-6-phosphate isomerase [Roseomonas sp. CCTCC AB2023176]|uniref:mannose-1-phosphate guanylyltransferase/mannose-6-phosphate isomerase n=1 Tax=Roseomonas sp. CCTCC AB2023176 TaxID=3342640 RepID=UPI0035DF7494
MSEQKVVPVILSGGVGTRLWPLSRQNFPKQLQPLLGEHSMLRVTMDRARGVTATGLGFAPPVIVCSEAHRFTVAEQVREAGIANARIVLEPAGRNSAPAIATAALVTEEADPDAVLWILAADHAIADVPALHAALARAAAAARAGRIVTFGMRPTAPETGFGYVEAGEALPELEGVSAVASFVEKPDPERAAAFVAGGRHLWNSGMFVAQARVLVSELERLAPEILHAARAGLAAATRDLDFVRLGAPFAEAPAISIDYAVMERTDRAAVVPCDLGWSDVGSWDALWAASPRDARGNAVHGPGHVELLDTEGCYVRSDGVLTAVVGARDLVVVTTDDAVLVVPRDRAQDVKGMVDALKAAGRGEVATHRRAYRPWGHYEGLILGDRFQVKKIQVRPGGKLSLQKHFHRAEHWVVVNGTAIIERDAERLLVRENESVYLPLGCVHRLENPGMIPLNLIEVQVGSYLGEDDIVRLEDTYGRA